MSLRGFADTGLPPFLIRARASIFSVSSGSSRYSSGLMVCASTLARSDFKPGREAPFFAAIGLPHAEYVSIGAPWGVAHDYKAPLQKSVTNDPRLTVVSAYIVDLDGDAFEDERSVLEIQAASRKSAGPFDGIVCDAHGYCNYKNKGCQVAVAEPSTLRRRLWHKAVHFYARSTQMREAQTRLSGRCR